jgi:hypothetical protein
MMSRIVLVCWIVVGAANAQRPSVSRADGPSSGADDTGAAIHDVLVSTFDLSLPPSDFVSSAKTFEKRVRESFVGVPDNFTLRFDGNALLLIGVTKSGRLPNTSFKHRWRRC